MKRPRRGRCTRRCGASGKPGRGRLRCSSRRGCSCSPSPSPTYWRRAPLRRGAARHSAHGCKKLWHTGRRRGARTNQRRGKRIMSARAAMRAGARHGADDRAALRAAFLFLVLCVPFSTCVLCGRAQRAPSCEAACGMLGALPGAARLLTRTHTRTPQPRGRGALPRARRRDVRRVLRGRPQRGRARRAAACALRALVPGARRRDVRALPLCLRGHQGGRAAPRGHRQARRRRLHMIG